MLHHDVMNYPTDFKFFFNQTDLPYLVTVCRHVGPSVDTDPVHVQHHLIWSIDFNVAPVTFFIQGPPVVSSARTALDSVRGSTCLR